MFHIGVDVGGTNVKLALVEEGAKGAKIALKTKFPTARMEYVALCAKIAEEAGKLLEKKGLRKEDLSSVGVALPGSIDAAGDVLVHAFNLGYHGTPIRPELAKYFPDTPIVLANDANAAALAEMYGGAFDGYKNALLLTLGTGLGGGIILNGKVFNGGRNHGAEIGHLPFRNGDLPCTCGLKGCAEVYTCAIWLKNQAKARLGEEYADAKKVIDAAKEGNETAKDILSEYTDNLATFIAGLCSLFDPEIVALGGGVSEAGEILYKDLEKLVEERNFYREHYRIVPAMQGNDAGSLGAAMLYANGVR